MLNDLKFNDCFVSYLMKEYDKYKKSHNNNSEWKRIQRDFKRIFTFNGEVNSYIHFAYAGVTRLNGYGFECQKLIGYLIANNIFSFNKDGISFGSALAKIGRNEDKLNFILSCSKEELLLQIRQLVGLMVQQDVKIDIYPLIYQLYNWDAQKLSDHPNWIKKQWTHDYYITATKGKK